MFYQYNMKNLKPITRKSEALAASKVKSNSPAKPFPSSSAYTRMSFSLFAIFRKTPNCNNSKEISYNYEMIQSDLFENTW